MQKKSMRAGRGTKTVTFELEEERHGPRGGGTPRSEAESCVAGSDGASRPEAGADAAAASVMTTDNQRGERQEPCVDGDGSPNKGTGPQTQGESALAASATADCISDKRGVFFCDDRTDVPKNPGAEAELLPVNLVGSATTTDSRIGDGAGLGPCTQEPEGSGALPAAVISTTDCTQPASPEQEENGAYQARTVDTPTDPLVGPTPRAVPRAGNGHRLSPAGLRGGQRSGPPTWHNAPSWEAAKLRQYPQKISVPVQDANSTPDLASEVPEFVDSFEEDEDATEEERAERRATAIEMKRLSEEMRDRTLKVNAVGSSATSAYIHMWVIPSKGHSRKLKDGQ